MLLAGAIAARLDLARLDRWAARLSRDGASAQRAKRFNRAAIAVLTLMGVALIVAGLVSTVAN